jgi:phosphatidyl-myo-inositol alpha-mannosyltransferase
MKIALVSPYDYTHPGGVTNHIAHLQTEFERVGHDVTVLAPQSRKGGLTVSDGFVGVGRTVSIPGNGSMVRLTFDVTLYAAVKQLMRRENFDVVHVHEPLVPALPYMVLLTSNAVNVGTFHASGASSGWYKTLKPYMNLLMSRLDARIAVSEPARSFVSQYFDGPYEIIPNGIDLERFREPVPLPWAGDGRPRILFVGRFTEPRKGFKYLLRAMPLVHQQFPEARLVVVGSGKPEKFQGMMEKYGVNNVDFVGMVPPAELPRYYASCDVFCAPSTGRESFGIVLLEAMAAGKPVVAGDNPGYSAVLGRCETGVLVPPKDPQALGISLVRLLADGELRDRLGAAGIIYAGGFAWPQVASRILDVYERAAAGAALATR